MCSFDVDPSSVPLPTSQSWTWKYKVTFLKNHAPFQAWSRWASTSPPPAVFFFFSLLTNSPFTSRPQMALLISPIFKYKWLPGTTQKCVSVFASVTEQRAGACPSPAKQTVSIQVRLTTRNLLHVMQASVEEEKKKRPNIVRACVHRAGVCPRSLAVGRFLFSRIQS